MRWVDPPRTLLEHNKEINLSFEAQILPSFWKDAGNINLLGKDFARFRRLCDNVTSPNATNCTHDAPQNCCVHHSNVHACMRQLGSCVPTHVAHQLAQGSLYTQTASAVGPLQKFSFSFKLAAGSWTIIAHLKIMNFQCAVGSQRTVSASVLVAPKDITLLLVFSIAIPSLVLAAGGLALRWYIRRREEACRDLRNAPKSGICVILFTDIQRSTALWNSAPVSMSAAMDIHHRVIRDEIVAHGGYEVKTIGDSFMIAVSDVSRAVHLAMDIQLALHRQSWPRCIDGLYVGEVVNDDSGDLVFKEGVWNGLRVRIGMHLFEPDVVFDEVSKGYDYYGPGVNVAARVESIAFGGQVLVTATVMEQLGAVCDIVPQNMGSVRLRGIKEGIDIYQLSPVGLCGREFGDTHERAKEALQREGEEPEEEEVDKMSNRSQDSALGDQETFVSRMVQLHPLVVHGDMTATALRALVLDKVDHIRSLLQPFSTKEAVKVTRALCDKWKTPFDARHMTRALCILAMTIVATEGRQRQQPSAVRVSKQK
jgi:class 3 adenylate cyclase